MRFDYSQGLPTPICDTVQETLLLEAAALDADLTSERFTTAMSEKEIIVALKRQGELTRQTLAVTRQMNTDPNFVSNS